MSPAITRSTSGGIATMSAGPESEKDAAPPLVLLHGIGSNARSFTALIEALASTRRVLAWDAPGYGGSLPLALDWPRADDYADTLADLLDRLAIGRIDLLGHSLGALVAGAFAARRPDRVRRLVLASPALGYGTRPGEDLAPPAAARLDAMIAEGPVAFAATRGPRLVYDRSAKSLVDSVTKAMSEVRLPGYQHASRMLSCGDLLADARRLTMPALVIVGDHDEITPPGNCRKVFDAATAATPTLGHAFELIANAGHAVAQERPAAVAEAVARFLARAGA